MNHPVRRPRASIPTTVCITAHEALMWIAFGKAVVNEDPFKQFTTYTELLKTTETADVLEALEGRLAEHPYCAIRSREPGDYPDDALSPRGPVLLRRIRADARRAEMRLISYADLEFELRAERAHNECLKSRLNEATDKLLDALRIEALTAFGQMDNRGVADTGASFEPIPFSVFDDPGVSITRQDRVCAVTKNGDRGKPSYDNVRFKMAEILALWPASAEEPSISLDALSAEWGLLECVAWIMLRDAAVVHSVAPEQMWDGPRTTTTRLDVISSMRGAEQRGVEQVGPSSQRAEAELLDRLRRSVLHATGSPDGGHRTLFQLAFGSG